MHLSYENKRIGLALLVLIIQFLFIIPSISQTTIKLKNPSFEGMPQIGTEKASEIRGWYDCGVKEFPNASAPDIHPLPYAAWGVRKQAYHGNTYLGLVIRYDGSYESISQKLSAPMEKGKCYSFSGTLALSETFLSPTPRSFSEVEDFSHPAVLMIWGGTNFCNNVELLAQSIPVGNIDWKTFNFNLTPSNDFDYIMLEASHDPKLLNLYNGHILIDGLSPIVEVECK